ncbi:MAG: Glycosyl transferase, group 1 [uncultured Solirubrobacteraceae bacterium]|uniref:Glycosyl transferase, group 1 n=1 Tax=uncultured Solirubrobacteraceae bacterium TaxID=1162706 RepID=A0A6J4T2S0_9ACTN|nr:MAG: Glycosyl transferase, group 1 [uncultured Solirubrobacteraceae bacterium]
MRIALVSEHASPLAVVGGVDAGGQNVHVAALARGLASRGAQVVVHTRRDDPATPRRVPLYPGVDVDHIDAGPATPIPKDELLVHMDAFAGELERRWREDRPDVVHSHFWMSGLAAVRAAERLRLPVAHTFHALGVVKRRYQGDADPSPAERQDIERDVVARVDRIVATCTDEAFELMRMGADRSKVTVVPCGVDLERFRPDGPREERRLPHRLLYAGRLVERKGIGNVITALADVSGCELVVAGGGLRTTLTRDPEAQRLRALAEERGVGDRVELRGRVSHDELPALLRSADALVSVPWYEPFGITPLEAMACGVPVVASAVGGMIDTVVDGLTGRHVPPRDPERLAAVLRDVLADPARRAAQGRAGVQRTRQLYAWDRVALATLDVYEALLARRRPTRRAGRFGRDTGAASHVDQLRAALTTSGSMLARAESWGARLARRLDAGGRLLAVGNGGSAAQAQHLTAELVGRFETERRALSAICLHGDTSALTAIANDYGIEEAFARQVHAHARPGDVLLGFSTSGRSANVLAAARAARECGMTVWGLTGPAPNPLADLCDDVVVVDAERTCTIQELHLVAIHVLCSAVDAALEAGVAPRAKRLQA